MKDPIITNKEFFGEISAFKKEISGNGDAFSWETAYRGNWQSQSEPQQVEVSLRKSEDKYRWLVEAATDWVWATDLDGRHTFSNPAIYPLLGYQVGEVTGSSTIPPVHPEDEQPFRKMIMQCKEQKIGWQNFSIRRVHKDGSIRSFESTAYPIVNAGGQVEGFRGFDRDITERKRIEVALQKARDELEQRVADRTAELMRVNQELRTEITESKLAEAAMKQARDELEQRAANRTAELMRVNQELRTEITESKLAEAAMKQARDEQKQRAADRTAELMRVNQELRTEITESKLAEAALQQARTEQEQRAADRAAELMRVNEELRTEITERKRAEEAIVTTTNDWENTFDSITDIITFHDEDFNIVQANQAAKAILDMHMPEEMSLAKYFRGYHGMEKPPIEYPSPGCQAEMPYTVEMFEPYLNKHLEIRAMPKLGSNGRFVGSIHVVRDITERKKAEERLQCTLDGFKKTVGTTIQVMGSAVETKDPYTAGHHVRSTALAFNIARMMGLAQDKIDAIQMAGSIHDIGKLSVPAEILSKPGKLTEIELQLIREHAKKGYDILKDVEFPWPLAEIVHQHHERMDGSGYPRNLKGKEICIEARIMAVADVVEAMTAQRPYRPALRIEVAMEEIEKNIGTLYDNTVADACLRLFREKGFQLTET